MPKNRILTFDDINLVQINVRSCSCMIDQPFCKFLLIIESFASSETVVTDWNILEQVVQAHLGLPWKNFLGGEIQLRQYCIKGLNFDNSTIKSEAEKSHFVPVISLH